MTRKQKRMVWIAGGGVVLCAVVGLVAFALSSFISLFFTPSELLAAQVPADQRVRLGGKVEPGSVLQAEGAAVRFTITDCETVVPAVFDGILPDLFRENQMVVVHGRLGADGVFVADEVLAKHDENYVPPELADTIAAEEECIGMEQAMGRGGGGATRR